MAGKYTFAQFALASYTWASGHWVGTGTDHAVGEVPETPRPITTEEETYRPQQEVADVHH